MRGRSPVLIALLAVLALLGCGSAPEDQGSGEEITLSDLNGTWENSLVTLEVNTAGEFVLRDHSDPGESLMGGFVARDGHELQFVTSTTAECPGMTGSYRGSLDDGVLTLVLVEDPCELRSVGFASPMTAMG